MKKPPSSFEELIEYGTLDQLIVLAKKLKQENELLRAQPTSSAVSSEEQICLQQLRLLEEKSAICELDFEEAKKFEIFHKNLRLARGQVVDATDKKKSNQQLSTVELLKIAGV